VDVLADLIAVAAELARDLPNDRKTDATMIELAKLSYHQTDEAKQIERLRIAADKANRLLDEVKAKNQTTAA
jgi:hypothetical protein